VVAAAGVATHPLGLEVLDQRVDHRVEVALEEGRELVDGVADPVVSRAAPLRFARAVAHSTAAASMAVGVWWLVRATIG
jgi:hypothetical protein